MGYAALLRSNIKKAFNTAGDLAMFATLTQSTNAGYDFANSSVKASKSTSKVVKVILVTKRKNSSDKVDNALQISFLMKAEDISDPTVYDTLTVTVGPALAVGTWKMVPPYINDGYLITVNCTKEA